MCCLFVECPMARDSSKQAGVSSSFTWQSWIPCYCAAGTVANWRDALEAFINLFPYNRTLLFTIAVASYLLVATLAERELSLSVSELGDATCGAVLGALLVFYALPRLLYRERYALFALFCLVGVALCGTLNEVVLDPLLLPAGDPRLGISRWGYINGLVSAFSIAAIVALFDNLDYQRRLRQVGELRKAAELATLKQQLNPHIVLNNLNNLYALCLEQDPRAPDQVMMLANILRYSLYETEDPSASLAREVELLESYFALQEVALGERVQIDFQVEGVPAEHQIAPLLLLPLVENAFKHGSAVAHENPLKISFQLCARDQRISFVSENPFDQTVQAAGGRGIGLENLQDRLKLAYPNRHTLTLTACGDTYRAELTVEGAPA